MILHFDFSTGASGDKVLGALLEVCEQLGLADADDLQQVAAALVPGAQALRGRLAQGAVQATSLTVTEPDAPHRHWSAIREQILRAGRDGVLSDGAVAYSLQAFQAIAEAEAAVHGCAVEQVHFHEVGAADSIIDICFSSFLVDRLQPEAVFATPLALGFGTVACAHGELSVPAPATAQLVLGLPVYAGTHQGELTTPTGAALARTFVSSWQPLPCVRPLCVGYGAGSRQIPGAANVVRLLAGRRCGMTAAAGLMVEGCALLETNIDHISPESVAFACEELLDAGALDVWQEPITMKKGRLAVRLCLLVKAGDAADFAADIGRLTGSLGIRSRYVERLVAPRELLVLETPYGAVPFKVARFSCPDDTGFQAGAAVSAGGTADGTAAGVEVGGGDGGAGDGAAAALEVGGGGGGTTAGTAVSDGAGAASADGGGGGMDCWIRPEYQAVARIARERRLDFNALYAELSQIGQSELCS